MEAHEEGGKEVTHFFSLSALRSAENKINRRAKETWICARQGLRKIDIDFTGQTLGDLRGLLPENLGPNVEKDLKDPALQLILNGRILAAPLDLREELQPEDQLTFLKALDGG